MIQWLRKRWVYHLAIWFAGFGLLIGTATITSEDESMSEVIRNFSLFFIPWIPLVYVNFYAKKKLYEERKYLAYLVVVLLLVGAGMAFYQLLYLFFPLSTQHPSQDASNVFFILAISLGLQYVKRGVIGQFQMQELKAKTSLMELNALKAQVNPHFLFNTLNNIYATNQTDPTKGSEMIIELAEVMRYHLRFSDMKSIPLEEEIQLIRSYIALEKLRLQVNARLDIDLPATETYAGLRIEPLVLLPFVENAFKYGTHPTQPCFIEMNLMVRDQTLVFNLKNSIIYHKKTVKTGLGIENTQRRLSIIYPDRHELSIDRTKDEFYVKLTLKL